MNERKIEFYNNLIIKDEDKENAENSLKSKGIEKHILIKERLLAWSETESIEYTKIASTYRYEKRIRLVLFKYISYLEEYYRAIILDNYNFNLEQAFWANKMKTNIKNFGDLNDALERLGFFTLLLQCAKLPNEIKLLCNLPIDRHLNANIKALKELRNAVMHNKFLLLYRGFEKCYVKGVDDNKSSNLKANILNLIQFLPVEVGKQCVKDIEACKENRNKDSDTDWDLPTHIVISINK